MIEKDDLSEVIEKAKFWYITDKGYYPSYTWSGGIPSENSAYTREEFVAIDPRLAEIFDYVGDGTPGQYLRNALDWWSKPRMTLPLRNHVGRITGEHVVKEFDTFTILPGMQDITIKFVRYEISTRPSGTSFPSSVQPYMIEAPRYWLDEHYPKWEERYLVAKSLDFDAETLTRFIAEPGMALPAVTVDTIEFD